MGLVAALPITDPVLIFALAMVIFVGAPLLFERLRVPGLIGLIVAGAVVGPNGLNLLERGVTIVLLGTVGLLYLMFMVGLELDLHDFGRYRNRSIIFGSLSFVVPQLAGTTLGILYGYPLATSLLLGAVFASHTVLAYPIASRLGIIKNLAVTTTVGGTILTEILALLVLAIVAGSAGGSLNLQFWLILISSLAVYIGAVLWGVPILARFFFRHVRSDSTLEFVFVMAVLFTVAWLAHFAKAEPIIGALLAGLALNRLIPQNGPLMNRINFAGNALFIPFFLLSVGMLVDVQALSTTDAWIFALGVAGSVIVSKLIAAKATERVFGFNREEGWVIFGLSVPHASGTLAIALVGFELTLFDLMEVNGIVLTILVSSLVGPWIVERFGRQVALQEEQKPYEPREAPQRILIPIANPATEESLLDLAMLLRGTGTDEPLHPLTVVPEHAEGSDAQVAEAERMLSHAVIYAAGAEVPVVPLTRVDQNVAAGIVRGIAETRASTVVIGWEGGRSPVGGVFGNVLDQLLLQTKALVVVAKLGHPLNVTKRLVLVLPPLIYRHPGSFEAFRGVKTIASQLGTPILGLALDEEPARLEALLQPIRPAAAIQLERVDGWGRLLKGLRERVRPDDLVVVLSARRGTLPWNPKLERLPGQLAGLLPESFLMFYPAEVDTPRREPVAPRVLPRGLQPDRIVFDLPQTTFPEALQAILSRAIDDRSKVEAIVAVLVQLEEDFSTEVRAGVVVPNARVAGIEESVLFLGTCTEGIEVPNARAPANLIFILLSPDARPQEHLRSLAEIARLVSQEKYVRELLGRSEKPAAANAEAESEPVAGPRNG